LANFAITGIAKLHQPGWPGCGGARGGATLARAGTTCGGECGGARRPRRRDGITTPAVGDSRGKAVWEEEERARKLTMLSIREEVDRRGSSACEGGAPTKL